MALRLRGVVQGVGLRPAVCRFARSLGVAGFVRNEGGEVHIEVEGPGPLIEHFAHVLPQQLPPHARIDAMEAGPVAVRNEQGFRVVVSEAGVGRVSSIPPDLAPCEACLQELSDRQSRRYRYPFVNCTDCGPRFTIAESPPYDRERTTMRAFPMCETCRGEYETLADRRYHAEPNACPSCGPQVSLHHGEAGEALRGHAALERAAELLAQGAIVALKGVGGYALAVDATDAAAVARLRARKKRPHKPFAVMVRTIEDADRIAFLDASAREALQSPARPIVIAPAVPYAGLACEVAPGLADVGVLLPPSPLQQLLAELASPYLVMTSGNRSSEPIAIEDHDARHRLQDVADAFLSHDRAIHRRADDAVVRSVARAVLPVRHGRGQAPQSLALPVEGPAVLAVGAQQANSVCVAAAGRAWPSQHVGDLDHPDTYAFFRQVISDLLQATGAAPAAIVHDLHPDYRSTRWALAAGLPTVGVQHHHAHVASCMVEHGLTGPVLGVAFDGTGLGPDGTLWGGDLLEADLDEFRRLGHLRALPLAGGEAAIREPWRLALAALLDAGAPVDTLRGVEPQRVDAVCALLERGTFSVRSSGAGRWFDAVAALCGLRKAISYDGQAAAELEAAATRSPRCPAPYPFEVERPPEGPFCLDLRPTVAAIAVALRSGRTTPEIAARFHETLACAIAHGCQLARGAGAPPRVALSGGCFQNRRLAGRTRELLEQRGFEVLSHRRLPPNDGGLALGQAAVATQRLRRRTTATSDPAVDREESNGHVSRDSR